MQFSSEVSVLGSSYDQILIEPQLFITCNCK